MAIGQNLSMWPGTFPHKHRGASWFQMEADGRRRVGGSQASSSTPRDLKMLKLNLALPWLNSSVGWSIAQCAQVVDSILGWGACKNKPMNA